MTLAAPNERLLSGPRPGTPTLPPDTVAKTQAAARKFEAMALGQFLEPMFNTVESSNSLFGGGAAEETWKPMLVNEIAKHVCAHGGLGIAAAVFTQMLRTQEARS